MNDKLQRAQIDDELYLVLRTIYHYERNIAGRYGLDFQQIYALQFLRRNANARLTDIAEEMGLPMFAASRLVRRLNEEGYLDRVKDSVDRRNQRIHILEKGEIVLQAIETASFERIIANIDEFPEQEVSELVEVARKLHVVLGVTGNVIKPTR
jgi:DNA-binding MarR family transcriptional regulator